MWVAVLFCFSGTTFAVNETRLGCGFDGDSVWQSQVAAFKKRDTLKALAIWACGANPPMGTNKLPVFWRAAGQKGLTGREVVYSF
jgi:hypothetical protein